MESFSRESAEYEQARRAAVWNQRTPERFPELIVKPRTDEDVIAAVREASAAGSRVTVRSGGKTWCHLADLAQFASSITPTWVSGFDLFPLEVIDNKTRILTQAAREGWWCSFGHDPLISFAQAETKDGKWRTINSLT